MKRLLLVVLGGMTIFAARAQQRAHYSQYMANKYLLNPAVAGTGDWVNVKLGYRTQWVGFQDQGASRYGILDNDFTGAPTTMYLTATTPIGRPHEMSGHHTRAGAKHEKHWHGVGTQLFKDQTGPISITGYYASYAYNMKLSHGFRIAFGAFLGGQSYRVDINKLYTAEDLSTGQQLYSDQALGTSDLSATVPDLGLGFWAYNDYFYVGLSGFQLLYNNLDFGVSDANLPSQLKGHFFLTAGVQLPANEVITIVPSFMVKNISPAPTSVDFDVRMKYKVDKFDMFWAGLSYRTSDSFTLLAGMTLPFDSGKAGFLDVGYSFDFTTSKLRTYNNGTHEIIVGYRFPLRPHVICASQFWH